MRRLHPQRAVRLVVLSYGTTMFQGIFEGMTGIAGVVSIYDEDQGVCFTSVKSTRNRLEDLSCLPPIFSVVLFVFSSSPP